MITITSNSYYVIVIFLELVILVVRMSEESLLEIL